MISIDEFLESYYFTALEVFVVSIFSQVIFLYIKLYNNISNGPISRRNNALFYRTKFWIRNNFKYCRSAIDIRRTFALNKMEKPLRADKFVFPENPFLMILPMLFGMGFSLYMSFSIGSKPALILPFEIPPLLKKFLQYGFPSNFEVDNYTVSAYGLYLALQTCSELFALMVPMGKAFKMTYTNKSNYKQYANRLAADPHKWELENAEDELLAMIDSKMK
ncbi:hypothetical protein TRFO_17860 [Tritrichomonas foetus]|uniref:ER membrane protein complex subunit 3 n=1 Tax=Tritrichomonas foetus TaxID=1144522 RepID=A0A1J4KRD3_9EUKA|nr:hypothetical protein TRFO_17860 [Tritrichomonas foetus]|eukprot:OHT12372.1 hypothetical protein TRFO_17860 [Tritrichomonas foetus]